MTTNKPEVFEVYRTKQGILDDVVLLSDYEALQAVCEELRIALDAHKAARIAYASEFPLGADGTPDVGSIHENIRLLKKDAERYRYLREGNQWIVAATQTGCHIDGEVLDELIDSEMEQQK